MTKTFSYFKYLALRTHGMFCKREISANQPRQQICFFNVKFYFFSLEFLFLMCTLMFKDNILFVMCRFLLSVLFVCHQN